MSNPLEPVTHSCEDAWPVQQGAPFPLQAIIATFVNHLIDFYWQKTASKRDAMDATDAHDVHLFTHVRRLLLGRLSSLGALLS